ncbi:MAG: lipocalin-like domain-containing protein [Prevotella sp.]|nr:lipocalin-like domain-containing protein [Prevotella sp.]
MRKWFIIPGFLSLMFLCGCELETTDNGDLDGYWHLEQVDSLAGQRSIDYGQSNIFWSIQFELLQLSNLEDNTIIYKLVYDNRQLTLANPCMFDRADGDTLVTNVEVLRQYGVNALQENFKVVTLESRTMVLESPVLRLHFKKY